VKKLVTIMYRDTYISVASFSESSSRRAHAQICNNFHNKAACHIASRNAGSRNNLNMPAHSHISLFGDLEVHIFCRRYPLCIERKCPLTFVQVMKNEDDGNDVGVKQWSFENSCVNVPEID
jgi:hypothetical protein